MNNVHRDEGVALNIRLLRLRLRRILAMTLALHVIASVFCEVNSSFPAPCVLSTR